MNNYNAATHFSVTFSLLLQIKIKKTSKYVTNDHKGKKLDKKLFETYMKILKEDILRDKQLYNFTSTNNCTPCTSYSTDKSTPSTSSSTDNSTKLCDVCVHGASAVAVLAIGVFWYIT